jgi:hypothetical protein
MSSPDDYGLSQNLKFPRVVQAEPVPMRQIDIQAAQAEEAEPDARQVVINRVAQDIRWLPLRSAVQMAEEIVNLPDYKSKAETWPNKIELAMILNAWAFTKGED